MQPTLRAPDTTEVIDGIRSVGAAYDGTTRSIDEWRQDSLAAIRQNLQLTDIAVFNRFVNCLLERATSGESFERRRRSINALFHAFADYTPANVSRMLKEGGYRFPKKGPVAILGAKAVVTAAGFTWRAYVRRAEQHYETDFSDDDFLDIKGVAFKTRDLALSELSDKFVAIDTHVVRVTARTGLLLHGYGDPRISTAVSDNKAYLFYHDLMLNLARQTGWSGTGYSLGEIDRMLWHFGRTVCRATPQCQACPIAEICCTANRQA
jgi:endonuclease III